MNSNSIPFEFDSHPVRVIDLAGQAWFFATDICVSLGLTDTNKALLGLDEDEKCKHEHYSCSGRKPILVNESGLYSMVLRSRKPEAKRFKRWVTHEVLPAIRKHGQYQDTGNQMATLIGQTIGTDGFHVLGSVIKGKVATLPAAVRRRATAKIWSQTHAAFGVRSAGDIPVDQLDSARNFIAAYAIEGEFLPKPEAADQVISLNAHDAQHVNLLMTRFFHMDKHREALFQAARALQSQPLMAVYSQLREGRVSFSYLEQCIGNKLNTEYQALGAQRMAG